MSSRTSTEPHLSYKLWKLKLWSTIFSCQKYSRLITFLWIFCTHIQSWPRFSKCKRGMSWASKGTENFFFAYFFWLALTKLKICRYSKNFWVCPFFCTINWLENGKLGQKNLTLTQEKCSLLHFYEERCSSHSKIIFDFLCFISYARSQFYCFKDRKCFSIDRGSQFLYST